MKSNMIRHLKVVGFSIVMLPVTIVAAGNVKRNSKVVLSGNILASSQIVPVGGQVKTVMGAGAGKIGFSSTRFCGDGDVARYHSSHPETEFYAADDADTNIIVGYWISPEGTLDLSAKKFFSVGYVTDSKIDADVTEKMIATNFSTLPPKKTFNLIDSAVKDLATISEMTTPASVQGLTTTKFNMKFVAMACPVIKNTNGVGSSSGMNNLTVTKQFLTGKNLVGSATLLQEHMHNTLIKSDASISDTRLQINNGGGLAFDKSIGLSFSGSSGDHLDSDLINLVNDLANKVKPGKHSQTLTALPSLSCTCETLDHKNDLATLRARFNDFKSKFNAAKANSSLCEASPTIKFNSVDYPWESFRTNAACQMYHKLLGSDLTAFETAFNEMFDASDANKTTCNDVKAAMDSTGSCPAISVSALSNIDDSVYLDRKKTLNQMLMKIAGTPNAIQIAQTQLKTKINSGDPDFALNTASCFPLTYPTTGEKGQYIKYISSSVGIDFDPDPAVTGSKIISINKQGVSHPEGNFAVGGDAPYLTDNGNARIIFNNTLGDPKLNSSFKVELGVATPVALSTGMANVQFHIRSIGCSQNVYCYNDR